MLEITEDAAAGDYEEVSEAVGALRASGVRIALDDTGSGSVSFNGLFDVHADIIKIDIDVTHGIASDPMKEAMASALKSLADRLGAMSLAEGIETEEELDSCGKSVFRLVRDIFSAVLSRWGTTGRRRGRLFPTGAPGRRPGHLAQRMPAEPMSCLRAFLSSN